MSGFDLIGKIIEYEAGELSETEIIELFKNLYLTNTLFGLQGHYQRQFNALIDAGLIDLKQLNVVKAL